jgi:cysteine desulfurase/selenocysteine lyase
MFEQGLLSEVRDRFHNVDECPYQGLRAFFENAGGSLTLKSVVEVNTTLSSIPDNQGRDNPASHEMVRLINKGKQDIKDFMGTSEGTVFIGESGTEILFRLIRSAVLGSKKGGVILGSTLEHPATVSACKRWSEIAEKSYVEVPHNSDTGSVSAEDYQKYVTADTCVATIIQTSPVTGVEVDVTEVVKVIRSVSPDCLIIVDGIQHSAHGEVHLDEYDVEGFVVSAYKVFSRHNYGVGWASPRLSVMAHDKLDGTPEDFWELGTRDASAYATFSEVVHYLEWLGSQFTDSTDRRELLDCAGDAIKKQESYLVDIMINGDSDTKGLRHMPEVIVIGGYDNEDRAGLVSMAIKGVPSVDVVKTLNEAGIRTHLRKADYFSANILDPLEMDSCIRVSMCHYNSKEEVLKFLGVVKGITQTL